MSFHTVERIVRCGVFGTSWCLTLHWAHLKGIDFGNDLVFTFGPWGFIYQGYVPETFGWTIAGLDLIRGDFLRGIKIGIRACRGRCGPDVDGGDHRAGGDDYSDDAG